jgi:hypothetical protein
MQMIRFVVLLLVIPLLFFACSDKKEVEKKKKNIQAVNWPIFRGDSNLSGTVSNNQKLLRGVQGGSILEKSPPGRRRQSFVFKITNRLLYRSSPGAGTV